MLAYPCSEAKVILLWRDDILAALRVDIQRLEAVHLMTVGIDHDAGANNLLVAITVRRNCTHNDGDIQTVQLLGDHDRTEEPTDLWKRYELYPWRTIHPTHPPSVHPRRQHISHVDSL